MSKKTLLSALLISSLSLSTVFASAAVEMGTEPTGVAFKNCVFSHFPLHPSTRDIVTEMSFPNCTLPTLDPSFFVGNKTLKKLALAGSLADFTPFKGGKFGQGCTSLEVLNLKGIQKLTFEDFLSYAAPDLLDRIVAGHCKLKFSCADSGATLARFQSDTDKEELSKDTITAYIKMFRNAQAATRAAQKPDEPASPNTGGLWGTVWSMFGGTAAAK